MPVYPGALRVADDPGVDRLVQHHGVFRGAIIKDKISQCDAKGLGVVYPGQAYVGEPAKEALRGSAQVSCRR